MMKKMILLLASIVLFGCADKPHESTKSIYDTALTTDKPSTTHVRVHRAKQLSGSALGENCPLVLIVDNNEVAGLQQNQFVDIYLSSGNHSLSVRFKCAITAWKKSVDVFADGKYQEYETEIGVAGQYRMWKIN